MIGKGHQSVVAGLVEGKTQYTILAKSKIKKPNRPAYALSRHSPISTPHRSVDQTKTPTDSPESAKVKTLRQRYTKGT